MYIAGLLRVKNEARWIERCLRSIAGFCDEIHVLDDHSTDATPDLCRQLGATVYNSPFEGLDECRDKSWLLATVEKRRCPDVALCIDGDEELEPGGDERLRTALRNGRSWSLRVAYLWDSPDRVRVDGVYGQFARVSMWRHRRGLRFKATGNGGNFHCGNVPAAVQPGSVKLPVRLLHWGYLDRETRIAKWHWYNQHDPGNEIEDRYRHIVQGDVPEVPADMKLKWGGPLKVQPV